MSVLGLVAAIMVSVTIGILLGAAGGWCASLVGIPAYLAVGWYCAGWDERRDERRRQREAQP